ncbi:MAG: ABC transporter ATP-binding protein [Fastidiosipila sp.]|jgi:NitT/TauT family transport system ATP-binding protein|nr:ABC transporter ATP-binding protein [Fastidiosipila sp.]
MKAEAMVSIEGISKSFRNQGKELNVLHNISIDIDNGEFVCILGHSGCGKSTLLRIVAALEQPDHGRILVDGVSHRYPNREVILLGQDFNQLLPWKKIVNNIVHPLRATRKISNRKAAKERALELLSAVGLSGYSDYYPHQLSGGMKQRAAVARALSLEPKVLLMDEPFAALDDVTRKQLRVLVRNICEQHNVTTLFVTHNIEEAITLGNRIVVMGKLAGAMRGVVLNEAYQKPDEKDLRIRMRSKILDYLENQ